LPLSFACPFSKGLLLRSLPVPLSRAFLLSVLFSKHPVSFPCKARERRVVSKQPVRSNPSLRERLLRREREQGVRSTTGKHSKATLQERVIPYGCFAPPGAALKKATPCFFPFGGYTGKARVTKHKQERRKKGLLLRSYTSRPYSFGEEKGLLLSLLFAKRKNEEVTPSFPEETGCFAVVRSTKPKGRTVESRKRTARPLREGVKEAGK
jgi:hypothetical protein